MNANMKRKRNAAFLLIAPLLCAAVLSAPQAHAGSTITVSGFAPKQMSKVLLKTEEMTFFHKVGSVKATCGGSAMQVSQVLPLYKVNARLISECPNRGLSVTFTSHRPTPPLTNATILKRP